MARKPSAAAPAFQFYVKDFMTGTITMSLAEVGAYSRLLCHQWDVGCVPGDDLSALARAMVCDRAEAEQIWPKIQHKFRQKRDGIWTNLRLEKERKKQAAYRKLQSEKGKRSAAKRTAVQPRLHSGSNRNATLHSSPAGSNTPPISPAGAGDVRILREDKRFADQLLKANQGYCPHRTDTCADQASCRARLEREHARHRRAS